MRDDFVRILETIKMIVAIGGSGGEQARERERDREREREGEREREREKGDVASLWDALSGV